MTSIGAALELARRQIPPGEARLLLRHVLEYSAAKIEAHRDDGLDQAAERTFNTLVERRRRGEPMAYLTGMREFYGRMFSVAPDVLIPRPETELIVDAVLARFGSGHALRILDMGTGSGCLAITLALELTGAHVSALDASRVALNIAEKNATQLEARVRFLESDWFASVADEQFDLVVANPPYIAAHDPHLAQGDLRFEPHAALASGSDGLDAIRHIVDGAPRHLNAGGWMLLEHGYDQAERVRDLLGHNGFCDIEQHRDLAGILRVCAGRRK